MVICNSIGEKFRCLTKEHGFIIISDATIDKGGLGQAFRPHEILESAYASCLNMFTQMQCKEMGIPFDNIAVKVNLTRLESKTIFSYSIEFGDDIEDFQKEKIFNLIEESPVRKTLSRPIFFEMQKDL